MCENEGVSAGNAFSDYGTFAHSLLEKWARGELDVFSMQDAWNNGYDKAITHDFPPYMKGYSEKAKQMGSEYFGSFAGFDGYRVVAAEEDFITDVGGNKFHGIVDLILQSVDDGSYMVIDHKTKSGSSMKKDFDLFRRQLYIYAAYVKEKYGKYPSKLAFNMIKTGELIEEEFSQETMDDTIRWVNDIIERIAMDTRFEPCPSSHMCQFMCDVRSRCPHVPIYTRP